MIGSGHKCGTGELTVEGSSDRKIAIGEAHSGFITSSKNSKSISARSIGALPEGKYRITLEDDENNIFSLTPLGSKAYGNIGMYIHGVNGGQSRQQASQRSILIDFNQRKKLRKYFDECDEMILTVEYR